MKNRGRSSKANKFVKLDGYMLECPAYMDLSSGARDTLVWLIKRYNGQNNGYISMSVREVRSLTHSGLATSSRYLKELVEHGFIRETYKGAFTVKDGERRATEWELTTERRGEKPPTKDFLRWPNAKVRS